ncbi:GRAM domain family protein [Leishmania donovani]|uniref:GRAM domain family protein n=2 Tax=Leishmania donovani species complex TaxID=38574 RepID=A0A504XBF1_LEIDO|nr:GRAM domain family protein [Leishmania donovani]
MSAKNRTPAEIQRSFVQHVQNISAHNRGISDELALMSQGLRDGIQSNTGPTTDLLAAASELSRFAMRACTNLSSCLEDLVNMGEAMAPVLAANPEAAEPLLLNFFSTFVTQMGAFYNEIDAWWGKGCESLGRGKAAFFRESSVSNTALATREPTASTAPTGAMPTADREREVSETAAVSTVHAGRRRNHQLLEDDSSRGSAEDTMAGLAAAAESGAQTALPQRPEKSSSRSVLPVADELAELTPEDLNALAQSEPSYLFLTSTLEDALGAVVMASRPNVFSNLASFTYNEPVSTYYIRLIRPGSLAYFVYCNYILGSADTQADFLCDVLETDCAEVDPFTSPAGEVIVEDAADLSSLPACAWAIGSSEDNERRLYTMYALIEQPPRVGPTAIIQDSLNMGAARDEVLHMVTLVDGAPEFARVTCMVYSEMRTAEIPTQKQAAILSFSRSGFAHTGFVEVPDSEVEAAVSRMRRKKQNAAGYKTVLFSKQELDATTTFQPPVQLASLNQPAGDAGISLGGVARGAVQGGFEVLKAPFTVGRAVGGALLDATGVTGAVRNNIEGVFRKSFPDLAGETLLDSFNCAWVEGSALKQGYLFITPHWLCFQSTLAAAHFSIEYDEIKDIIKSKSVKMFENAIEVKTHLNDTIFLTNFLQRDQAYSALMSQWLKQ